MCAAPGARSPRRCRPPTRASPPAAPSPPPPRSSGAASPGTASSRPAARPLAFSPAPLAPRLRPAQECRKQQIREDADGEKDQPLLPEKGAHGQKNPRLQGKEHAGGGRVRKKVVDDGGR